MYFQLERRLAAGAVAELHLVRPLIQPSMKKMSQELLRIVAIAIITFAPASSDAQKPTASPSSGDNELVGKWTLFAQQTAARTITSDQNPFIWEFTDSTLRVYRSNVPENQRDQKAGKYVIYPKSDPKAFDLVDEGKTGLGIYTLTGNKLIIVIPESPSSHLPRPTNIVDPGQGYMKMILIRAK